MNYSEAIQDLLWVQKRFKNLFEAIPELEKLSSLENTIQERTAVIDKLDTETATKKDLLASLEAGIETVEVKSQQILDNASVAAQKAIEDAKAEAKAVLKEADEKSSRKVSKAQEAVSTLEQTIVDKQSVLDGLLGEISKAEAQHTAVLKAIQDLKSKL